VVAFRDYQLDDSLWRIIAANIRDPDEVRGDLEAQFAANSLSASRIGEIVARHGAAEMLAGFAAVQEYGRRMMEAAIARIPNGRYEFSDVIEGDGISDREYRIHATVTVSDQRVTFDFSDTDTVAAGPINCGYASVAACVYYVMKALAGEETPANAGAFGPIEIVTKPNTLLQPVFPAAVCNANIVTTQRIVDVTLGALAEALPERIGAASSGTMHLLNIGIRHADRYLMLVETFGGGQGGLPGQDGMSAIHSHMSNTRNTPVEVLESTYPIVIEEYSLVENSAGAGRWRGGFGIRRVYRLLEPATITLSSDRHTHAPWGLAGGGAALAATNYRVLVTGEHVDLESKVSFQAEAGDRIVIETPGGGGYGPASARDSAALERDRRDDLISAQQSSVDRGANVPVPA
jgi:N-methylhydantoinase B